MLSQAKKTLRLAQAFVVAILGSGPACTFSRAREPVDVVQSRMFIFGAAKTAQVFWDLGQCSGPPADSISGTWTPSAVHVRLLETQLTDALRATLGTSAQVRAEDYYFQLFGVISRGRQVILVNGFHNSIRTGATEHPDDWMRSPVVVCDTGIGSFQANYDVKGRRLGELRFFSKFGGAL